MGNKNFIMLTGLISFAVLLSGFVYKDEPDVVIDSGDTQQVVELIKVTPEEPIVEEPVATTVYRVTAYCPCEMCCGEWAKNRPVDENGEVIVVGSAGVELINNYSAASPMAFGTQVELDGIGTVEIQDRTAKWVVDRYGENIIDIYMTDHKAAAEFGVQHIKGVIR